VEPFIARQSSVTPSGLVVIVVVQPSGTGAVIIIIIIIRPAAAPVGPHCFVTYPRAAESIGMVQYMVLTINAVVLAVTELQITWLRRREYLSRHPVQTLVRYEMSVERADLSPYSYLRYFDVSGRREECLANIADQ
jgi:hypothetical protein